MHFYILFKTQSFASSRSAADNYDADRRVCGEVTAFFLLFIMHVLLICGKCTRNVSVFSFYLHRKPQKFHFAVSLTVLRKNPRAIKVSPGKIFRFSRTAGADESAGLYDRLCARKPVHKRNRIHFYN